VSFPAGNHRIKARGGGGEKTVYGQIRRHSKQNAVQCDVRCETILTSHYGFLVMRLSILVRGEGGNLLELWLNKQFTRKAQYSKRQFMGGVIVSSRQHIIPRIYIWVTHSFNVDNWTGWRKFSIWDWRRGGVEGRGVEREREECYNKLNHKHYECTNGK
jgi:hypothetical protein